MSNKPNVKTPIPPEVKRVRKKLRKLYGRRVEVPQRIADPLEHILARAQEGRGTVLPKESVEALARVFIMQKGWVEALQDELDAITAELDEVWPEDEEDEEE